MRKRECHPTISPIYRANELEIINRRSGIHKDLDSSDQQKNNTKLSYDERTETAAEMMNKNSKVPDLKIRIW